MHSPAKKNVASVNLKEICVKKLKLNKNSERGDNIQ